MSPLCAPVQICKTIDRADLEIWGLRSVSKGSRAWRGRGLAHMRLAIRFWQKTSCYQESGCHRNDRVSRLAPEGSVAGLGSGPKYAASVLLCILYHACFLWTQPGHLGIRPH